MEQLPVLDIKAAFDRAVENANMGKNGPQDPTHCRIIYDDNEIGAALYYWNDSAHEGYALYVINQPVRSIMCSEWAYRDFDEDSAMMASDELYAYCDVFDDPKNLDADKIRAFIAEFDKQFAGA